MQFGVRRRTDARRIAQPHVFPDRGEIEIELPVVVGGVAFQVQRSAAGARGQLLDVDAVARKRQRAIHLAQAAGQSRIVRGPILDLDACLAGSGSFSVPPNVMWTIVSPEAVRFGVNAAEQLEISLPVGRQVQFLRTSAK